MNKIYIGNLSYDTTEDALKEVFSQYGTIKEVALIRDRGNNNRSKGFGFITFDTEEEAQKALAMDGKELLGRQLKVNIAKPRNDSNRNNNSRGKRW